MKQKPMVRFLAIVWSSLLLVTACGQDSADSQDVSDHNQSHNPADDTNAEISVPSGKNDIEPRDDLENERAGSWSRHEIIDDTSIRVFFTGGDPKCFGSRAMIEETSSEIRIAVINGSIPEAPEHCTAVGASNSMTVETEDEIDERDILHWEDPAL